VSDLLTLRHRNEEQCTEETTVLGDIFANRGTPKGSPTKDDPHLYAASGVDTSSVPTTDMRFIVNVHRN